MFGFLIVLLFLLLYPFVCSFSYCCMNGLQSLLKILYILLYLFVFMVVNVHIVKLRKGCLPSKDYPEW